MWREKKTPVDLRLAAMRAIGKNEKTRRSGFS
jgi:hypothetical protein